MNNSNTYFQKFVEEYGITEENNTIELKLYDFHSRMSQKGKYKIFAEDKEGNIDMLVYTLDRQLITYKHKDANPEKPNINNNRDKILKIKRFHTPRTYIDPKSGEEKTLKYEIPKGAGTFPFFAPALVQKYEQKAEIETLILTEGYKKAFYGALHGFDVIGLTSITCYKDKETQAMYEDIIKIISTCNVKNIIMLYDGDFRNFSTKALLSGTDLYTRPFSFYSSAVAIRELLKDYKVDFYFGHIKSEVHEKNPKGLDDILQCYPGHENLLLEDILAFSRPGMYFHKVNITNDTAKLAKYFCFEPQKFYALHAQEIGSNQFLYRGTAYQWNDKEGKLDVILPKELKQYFRVGDDFFKYVAVPNKYGQLERQYHRRNKETISMELPQKNLISKIEAYEAFCNVPGHENYSRVINNCFNLYNEFEYTPEAGDCPESYKFIKHIFGEQIRLGLDYIQLLYQRPTQVLPILCLVSKENNTGKSTFLKWMKAIFTQNMVFVGNADLKDNFNKTWSSKLIIACEETMVDKVETTEKLKGLSTGDKILMNSKGKDQVEMDFFGKFILASNREENFILAGKDDIRYWVRKIPLPTQDKVKLLDTLIEEIPAFLNTLNKRKLSTQCESRMWFKPSLIKTDALAKLIESSRPRVERDICTIIREMFLNFGNETLEIPLEFMKDNWRLREESSYIRRVLEENLKIERYKNGKGKFDSKLVAIPYFTNNDETMSIAYHYIRCRPYVFHREQFITDDDKQQHEIGEKQ